MKRPLADKRPLGPFAQSDEFRDTFLGGSPRDETFRQGDEGAIVISLTEGFDIRDISDAVDFFVEEQLRDFVGFVIEADGSLESTRSAADPDIYAAVYSIEGVADNDVTVSQVEQALEDFIISEVNVGIRNVVIHNSRTSRSPV